MKFSKTVNIIGCGFAGIECALLLASHGINVHIFDCNKSSYKCDCITCESLAKSDKNSSYARDLAREELKILNSKLIEEEIKFSKNGLIECGCVASRLLEFGKQLVKHNKKIQLFELDVKELDVDEINVVATGPHTSKELFNWLKEYFGSMRCIDDCYENPIVREVDTSLLFKKEGDDSEDLYYPLTYQEYIDFCNEIVKAHNDYLDLSGLKKVESGENSIEKLIGKDKDALKNFALRPCKLVGYEERPYAVLRLKKHKLGYELCSLASSLPYIFQDKIIFTLKPFKKAKLVKEARILQSIYINSPYVLNYTSQAVKNDKFFFAGCVIGLEGHLEAMLSGIYTAINVLSYIFGKKLKNLPESTLLGCLMKNIISQNTLKNSPLIANYDIMEEKNKDLVIENSKQVLLKFMEEFNGKQFNA